MYIERCSLNLELYSREGRGVEEPDEDMSEGVRGLRGTSAARCKVEVWRRVTAVLRDSCARLHLQDNSSHEFDEGACCPRSLRAVLWCAALLPEQCATLLSSARRGLYLHLFVYKFSLGLGAN